MNTLFKILVYLKQPEDVKSSLYPIYIRLTLEGKRAEISTKRDCEPGKWNKIAGKMIGTNEKARELNSFLDGLISKIYSCQNDLIHSCLPVTANAIKDKLNGKQDIRRMLIPIFKQHNKEVEKLVGKEYASGTLDRYKVTLNHVVEFMQKKYGIDDIDIKMLNYEFITDFHFFLRTVRNCGNNSAVKYIKNFKKIILICLSNDWLDKDPFLKFKQKVKEVDREFLSEVELQVLCNKQFDLPRIQLVKDLFVFSCYTGLAYVDAKNLTQQNMVMGIDGNYWIHTHRKKTDTPSHIPLLPQAMAIIEKYKDHPNVISKGVLLPLQSNQKMNAYLKEIADFCGIKKELTFHIARHTFATTVTLSNDVPIESVSKMLGHKSIKTTQHYAKILDKKVSKDMNTLRAKLGPKLQAVKDDKSNVS